MVRAFFLLVVLAPVAASAAPQGAACRSLRSGDQPDGAARIAIPPRYVVRTGGTGGGQQQRAGGGAQSHWMADFEHVKRSRDEIPGAPLNSS
jgi:hypothetical protein